MDAAWLRMAHPANPMVIIGVMTFQKKLDVKKLCMVLAERLPAFPRLKQKAIQDHSGTWWETDKHFDLAHHLKRAKLDRRGGKKELETFIGALAGESLDFTRPLWQILLVENYSGGCALVVRIHQCYADGAALAGVLLALTGKTATESLAPAKKLEGQAGSVINFRNFRDFWHSVSKPTTHIWNAATKLMRGILEQGLEIVKEPEHRPELGPPHMREFAARGMELAEALRRFTLMTPDAKSQLKGHPRHHKCVAWSAPLTLTEVKTIGKTLGCSINDVLLSIVTGALRNYLQQRGAVTSDEELRVAVPVNLRPLEKVTELGNQFGLAFIALPVQIDDPVERLHRIHERVQAVRKTHQAVVTSMLLNAIGLGPKIMQDQIGALIGRNATALAANLPGPPYPLYLAGREIAEIVFWTPQWAGIDLGFSFLTYQDQVQIGLIADAGLVSDPHNITDQLGAEFEKLVLATLLGPYGPGDAKTLGTFAAPAAAKPRPAHDNKKMAKPKN